MVRYRLKTEGFGFNTEESMHCFVIEIPRRNTGDVYVYEYFNFEDKNDRELKTVVKKELWNLVVPFIEKELNDTLTKYNIKSCKFKIGENIIERLLGKEICLLLYALEILEVDNENQINNTIINWLGIEREFRWYLFTMINATVGNYKEENLHKGWRQAVKTALNENPVSLKQLDRLEIRK